MKKWTFDKQSEAELKSLLEIYSPSSREAYTASYLRAEWQKMGLDVETDTMGNIYGTTNSTAKFTLALVAHMDVVSIQITKVLDNGLLLFRNLGVQLYSLIGQRVTIVSKGKKVEGIVGFDPLSESYYEKGITSQDLWIDIGSESKEESVSLIEIGDFAVLQSHYQKIGQYKICGAGIDDRIGMFIVNEILKWTIEHNVNISVCGIGSVQEEIGLRGAKVIGNTKKIDACIVIDVDFATDIPTNLDTITGDLILGKGVGISRKADNNMALQSLIVKIAKTNGHPYQINLGRRINGGTDADALQLQLCGIATANISIPCRYIHSANEICDIRDIENTINLLIDCVIDIDRINGINFIPTEEDYL